MKKRPLAQKPTPAPAATLLPEETAFGWKTALWAVPFFLILLLGVEDTLKQLCIVLAAACVVLLFLGWRKLGRRLNVQVLFALAYLLVMGASLFWTPGAVPGLREFCRIFVAVLCYLLILRLAGRGMSAGRNAATAMSIAAAALSLVSIDLVSTGVISGAFQAFTTRFITASYFQTAGLETGIRITSILDDPNIFAGVAGIGVLLSLGLAVSSKGKERILHTVCLFFSALGFVLVFSMGAAGFMVPAFVCYLIFLRSEERPGALVLMVETLVLVLAAAAICYTAVFDGTAENSPVPLTCLLVGAGALALADRLLGGPIGELLGAHTRLLWTAMGLLVAVVVLYGVAAVNFTGSASLDAGQVLERSAYLDAGEYRLSGEASGPLTVEIVAQNDTDLIMHTETGLYSGALSDAAFSVPEGSRVVWLRFAAAESAVLSECRYTGAEDGSVKLGYKLLPGFIANRLQGLRANENAVQRTAFWQDGIALWKESPLLGTGIGSFEARMFSVQSFYYVTRYVHNHYVQVLTDAGLLGLLSFLGLLGSSAYLFWTGWRRKGEASGLIPCLGAGLVFMILQASLQVDFSSPFFLPFAFGVFALLNICAGPTEELAAAKSGRAALGLRIGAAALSTAGIVLLCGNLMGPKIATGGNDSFFTRMQNAMSVDPLGRSIYMQSYVKGAPTVTSESIHATARRYALTLMEEPQNSEPCYAAEYFFTRGDFENGFTSLSKHLDMNRSKAEAWQYAFGLAETYDDGSASYAESVALLSDQLRSANEFLLAPIVLGEETVRYLTGLGLS